LVKNHGYLNFMVRKELVCTAVVSLFFAGDSVSFFKGRKYAELFVDRLMTSKRKKPFTTVFKYRLLVKGIINEFVNEKYDKKSRLKN